MIILSDILLTPMIVITHILLENELTNCKMTYSILNSII